MGRGPGRRTAAAQASGRGHCSTAALGRPGSGPLEGAVGTAERPFVSALGRESFSFPLSLVREMHLILTAGAVSDERERKPLSRSGSLCCL